MIITTATTTLLLAFAAGNSPPDPATPVPIVVEETIQYLTEQAPITCSRVNAYIYSTGHSPDVDNTVQRFVDVWADVPYVDTYALFYEGVVVGCITAVEADQQLVGR